MRQRSGARRAHGTRGAITTRAPVRLDDEKRNAKPESPSAGPIYGPELIGGDGGSLWTDADKCAGQYVTGFRIWHGDEVDTVQFQYGSNGWG